MLKRRLAIVSLAAVVALGAMVRAADEPKKPAKPASKPATKPAKVEKDYWTAPMDYGPFLMTSVSRPAAKPYKTSQYAGTDAPKFPVDSMAELIAGKGLVIPLGPKDAKGNPAVTVCYDLDTMAMASAWTGGWLDLTGTMQTNHKGTSQVTMAGKELFSNKGLGWGRGANGDDFTDPRKAGIGPLPEAVVQFEGIYVTTAGVLVRYRVNGCMVVERPDCRVTDMGTVVVTRELWIAERKSGLAVTWSQDASSRVYFPPLRGSMYKTLSFDSGTGEFSSNNLDLKHPEEPVSRLTVTTSGKLGTAPARSAKKAADPAFVVDEVTLPFQNPANSWMRLAGLDFFADGRAAVSTINGDVWIASGIDDKLEKITWTRFASGLYHPMGLKVVGDEVYVRCRDFLLRLKDNNRDGVADHYENVSGEGATHPSYHGFVFDLQTDPAGNFYYARGGIGMDPSLAGHGQLTQVSKDGKTVRTIASGLRAPNGLGMVGNGWVTVSDNQGNWIPSSKIHLIDPAKGGGFLGFLPHHHEKAIPTDAARPLVWIPHKLDNSSGGQCEVPAGAWGPFAGQWIHTSFGAACVTLLLPDANTPTGEMPSQAAVVRLPLEFATGIMRPRFHPKDGQLYVAGVGGGWQTKGTADGGLYRVRFTGKPSLAPTKFALVPGGVKLTFAQPLDKAEATDVQNYAVEQWNYKWSEKYGSPDFSAKNPAKAGHDEIEVKAAELSADGLTVTLKLAELAVVDQLRIQCNLKTAAGEELEQEVFATVNKLPK